MKRGSLFDAGPDGEPAPKPPPARVAIPHSLGDTRATVRRDPLAAEGVARFVIDLVRAGT